MKMRLPPEIELRAAAEGEVCGMVPKRMYIERSDLHMFGDCERCPGCDP